MGRVEIAGQVPTVDAARGQHCGVFARAVHRQATFTGGQPGAVGIERIRRRAAEIVLGVAVCGEHRGHNLLVPQAPRVARTREGQLGVPENRATAAYGERLEWLHRGARVDARAAIAQLAQDVAGRVNHHGGSNMTRFVETAAINDGKFDGAVNSEGIAGHGFIVGLPAHPTPPRDAQKLDE